MQSFRPKEKHEVTLLIQAFQVHAAGSGAGPGEVNNDRLKAVCPDGMPYVADALKLSSWPKLRDNMLKWRPTASGIAGCTMLVDPQSAKPDVLPTDPRCPGLLVVEELLKRGWHIAKSSGVLKHTADTPKLFSLTHGASRRPYYQCLLDLPRMLSAGLEFLPSNQPQAYYKLCMGGRFPKIGLGATAYKRLVHAKGVADQGDDLPAPADLEAEGEEVPPIMDEDSDEIIVPVMGAGNAEAHAQPHARPMAANRAKAKPSRTSSSSSSSSSAPIVAPLASGEGLYPRLLHGGHVRREVTAPKRGQPYKRFIVPCKYHPSCQKKRNVSSGTTSAFGQKEVFAYLHAWHAYGQHVGTAAAHIAHKPSALDISSAMQSLDGVQVDID